VVVDADGALTHVRFAGQARRMARCATPARCAAAAAQLREYFAGERRSSTSPGARGERLPARVWDALRGVGWGETVDYGSLAARIGRPGAARAVGRANATNPIPIVIPCHRVIGRDGSPTGYAGGVEAKVRLLALEGVGVGEGADGDGGARAQGRRPSGAPTRARETRPPSPKLLGEG
jgi:methylated-DNA-[protein]-cysteine S-methyltransferase